MGDSMEGFVGEEEDFCWIQQVTEVEILIKCSSEKH